MYGTLQKLSAIPVLVYALVQFLDQSFASLGSFDCWSGNVYLVPRGPQGKWLESPRLAFKGCLIGTIGCH